MFKYLKTLLIISILTVVSILSINANWIPSWFASANKTVKKELIWQYNFDSWKKACEDLPGYTIDAVRVQVASAHKTILPAQEMLNALSCYFKTLLADKELFLNKKNWVHEQSTDQLITSLQQEDAKPAFDPFVEKVVLNEGSIIAFHGDIHGDVHSLLAFMSHLQQKKFLRGFEIINPNFYMCFLGDYTDRGLYGPEVIYTILRLKAANPHRVFLVRGNHEDRGQNKSDQGSAHYHECFWSQLETLYPKSVAEEIFEKINKFYESMPVALYLGCKGEQQTDYILCCHGGIEMGFDPHMLLNHSNNHAFTKLGSLYRLEQLKKLNLKENEHILNLFKNANEAIKSFIDLVRSIFGIDFWPELLHAFEPKNIVTYQFLSRFRLEIPIFIGFQWNDYEVDSSVESWNHPCFIRSVLGRGFVIGKTFNKAILMLQSDTKNQIRGVFRAHQHVAYSKDPMMQRILNIDNLDFSVNKGVGRLWIPKGNKMLHPYQLWDNIVCTFNVSPNTIYQLAGYKEDTYGLLTMAFGYKNWRLDVICQKTVKE